ncbi:type II toxin-antitoxin system ParD family antitoxin [Methylobacterium durans]|uniref:Type II toxin-antitoxin system ParD family antitoxin n=1 Tax=Methylobacterium durans TaxID=2202825 RepID=A0A2U8W536_9HYPH|nr:type II toxin-antitoxin system ParD family antitoxin [Methylobacterium durans]AWN40748.1 type II toxin-antitoxin system ParD family antitoxin [Methylobacterium durans]
MAAKHSRHIALTGPLAEYVEAQVARGEYASASEMVRAALRLLMERDRAAARLILAAQTSSADE